MQVIKVFNNNVILVSTREHEEMIVMGRGLGFQKQPGDWIDEKAVEKIFILEEDDTTQKLADVYRELPPEGVSCLLAIIDYAEQNLQTKFHSPLYIALADHLAFAVERTKQNLPLKNPLAWEVRKLYKKEYNIGLQALSIIKSEMGIQLDEDEAASIALHLVNAQKNGNLMEQTMKITRIVQDILNIVRRHYVIEFDEDSIAYGRFVTHLQFFAQRVVTDVIQGTNDSFLYEQVQLNYPKAFDCTEKVKVYVNQTYHFDMGRDEQVYLTIHIQKLMS